MVHHSYLGDQILLKNIYIYTYLYQNAFIKILKKLSHSIIQKFASIQGPAFSWVFMAKKHWINIILRDLLVNIGDSRSVVLMRFFKDTTRFPVSFLILKRARPFNFSSHKVICINYGCEWPLGGREKWRIVYIEFTDNLSYDEFCIYNHPENSKFTIWQKKPKIRSVYRQTGIRRYE